MTNTCPSCGAAGMSAFYEVQSVPRHSVLLMRTRAAAVGYPRGDIVLGFCARCGFISNLAFDESVKEYSENYEETQGFSAVFSAFHRRLAERLIARHDLHNKTVIEIGCGKGEFLTLLCELGNNRGIGFDPAYVPARNQSAAKDRLTFIQDYYSEKHADYHADFICCKMTLEHIPRTAEMIRTVQRTLSEHSDTIVFFQVPDVKRILTDLAFWDIYYEHCSYFSLGALSRLFRSCGFEVLDVWRDYDDQYLMLEACAGSDGHLSPHPQENDLEETAGLVSHFSQNVQTKLHDWKSKFEVFKTDRRRVVLWGSGSKAVAFLTTLHLTDEIEYVVDLNPYRQGTYMAGAGHEIVAPAFLRAYRPEVVIAMNAVYREEIRRDLAGMGLEPELLTV